MGNIIFNIILLIIFSTLLKISFGIEDLREVDPFGAAGFPKIILLILVPLLLISLYTSVQEFLKNKKENISNKSTLIKKSTIITITIVVLLTIFISMLEVVGFLIASILLTPLLLIILGEKSKIRLILLSIFTPIILTGLFGVLLDIPLPRGVGLFMEISRLIY